MSRASEPTSAPPTGTATTSVSPVNDLAEGGVAGADMAAEVKPTTAEQAAEHGAPLGFELESIQRAASELSGGDPPCSASEEVVVYQGRRIVIVGTAHVSQRSVDDVRRVLAREKPDTVCVELDALRYEALNDPGRFRNLDVFQVLRQGKALYTLATLALSSFQRRLGKRLGVEPGAEMREAIAYAEAHRVGLILADRNVQVTLRRAWRNLGFFGKLTALSGLLGAAFSREEVSEAEIERLKERDALTEAMEQFAKALPAIKTPLIDERDRYLIASIREAPGATIVAVVGAGHLAGMVNALHQPVDRKALEAVPPPSVASKLARWLLPMAILLAFFVGYQRHAGEGVRELLLAWVLPNSVAAALLTLLALPRPLTVVVAFFASPITSLNPTLGAGMVTGLAEAWARKPSVADCEGIPEALGSLRGIYANRFTRVLLVAILSTLGSALGAWIGATWVLTRL